MQERESWELLPYTQSVYPPDIRICELSFSALVQCFLHWLIESSARLFRQYASNIQIDSKMHLDLRHIKVQRKYWPSNEETIVIVSLQVISRAGVIHLGFSQSICLVIQLIRKSCWLRAVSSHYQQTSWRREKQCWRFHRKTHGVLTAEEELSQGDVKQPHRAVLGGTIPTESFLSVETFRH